MSLQQKNKNFLLILFYLVRHPSRFYNALSARGRKWALRGLIFLLIVLIAVPTSLWYQAKRAQAAWWDENWAYRKAIPVTNNTTQESNVFVSVTTDTSDTSKFQTDCGDIRFTNLRGEILPYYIVSSCGTANTVIHVNFDVFPAGAQTIYTYYGNPSAPNGFSASDFATQASNYTIGSLGAEERGPGPVAYWKFDEGQGTTAQDATVNNNDGTISGATWKPESECVAGKCLDYNGSNNYTYTSNVALIAGNSQTYNKVTWSAWVKPNSGAVASKTIVHKNNEFRLMTDASGNPSCSIYSGGVWQTAAVSSAALEVNKWSHLACVYNGSNIYVYVNGVQRGSQGQSGNITSVNSTAVNIGRDSAGSGYFSGSIDEVKVYPYARTATQIQQDYNAGLAGMGTSQGAAATIGSDSPKWMTDGLVGWWKMDETEGTTVADASGNGNNGTLTNAQETGTAEAESTTTTVVDADNSALSTTDDAYNNMILRITGGTGCGITSGTERTVQDYTGSTRTFTVAAFSAEADNCTFEVRHQTGGKFGNGLGFEGTNDYVDVGNPTSLQMTDEITVAAWAKAELPYTTSAIVARYSSGLWKIHWSSNGYASFFVNGVGTAAAYVDQSKWHQYIGTYKKSTGEIKIYVDGKLRNVATGSGNIGTTGNIRIGSNYSGGWNYFRGEIDDVRIYNRALSPDEVRQLYEWGPGPVGWWKMDENVSGNNKTIVDSSGNGNNGTTNYGANATGMDCTKQGKYGGGCQFDGSDDYVNVGNTSSLNSIRNGGLTAQAWVYIKGEPNAFAPYIIDKGSGDFTNTPAYNQKGFTLSVGYNISPVRNMRWGIGYGTSMDAVQINYDNSELQGRWHFVTGVADSDSEPNAKVKLYVDGILRGSVNKTCKGPIDEVSRNLNFGKNQVSFRYINGLIDDVRIYNYARTPKQIVEDMNGGHPVGGSPIGSPLVHFDFNLGVGGTVPNSGNGGSSYNGTMTPQSGGSNTQTYQMWESGGKFGKAADLDGTDDYISIPDFSY